MEWWGPNAIEVPVNVQLGLVALLTGAVGFVGIPIGAAIGADAARASAEIAQGDAKAAREEAESARREYRQDALNARILPGVSGC